MNKAIEGKFSNALELHCYVKHQLLTNLEEAREEFKDYWVSWSPLNGDSYEGVLMCIEMGDGVVLCTDGEVRIMSIGN
ncbi:hypothetical protein BSP36_200 [Bacillus phage BSP36]|uniref:Uncharacterized protein n=1 Tax=Bacillus phage BSP38 TaxID=2283013 RepID=A0A345MK63_BPBSP|nr:hypothetical protein HWB82_gp115 [Bacillus phage BSP38]AXH71245.1 hypothetical protein BSP38_203 [Bacillus phage BSP38]AYJ75287.1 hypothetical protein BSP36_200 [Bacillus phage BSP36]